RFVAIHI
ncbi:hypothetical protein EC960932_5449, partial [Escherichia coli 96.0932]